jgi:hypothetical protein
VSFGGKLCVFRRKVVCLSEESCVSLGGKLCVFRRKGVCLSEESCVCLGGKSRLSSFKKF